VGGSAANMNKTFTTGLSPGENRQTVLRAREKRSPLPASRDFPRKRWQNKASRNNYLISGTKQSTGCCAPAQRGKGGAVGTNGGKSHRRWLITGMLFITHDSKVSIEQPSRRLVFNDISVTYDSYGDSSPGVRMTMRAGR